jgi:hypothetical protein
MKKTITMFTVAAAMLFAGVSAKAAVKGFAVKGPVSSAPSKAPAGGGSGLTITSVLTGTFEGIDPQYGAGFVAVPYPQNTIAAGASIVSTCQMQDNFFSGAPTVNYVLIQGGAVVQSASVTFPFDLVPNEEALAYFPDTAPSTTGPATIVMEVLDGTKVVGTSTVNIFIY